MSRRKPPDDPIPSYAVPVEAKSVPDEARRPDPLRDSSADVWRRWSQERDLRQRQAQMRIEAQQRELATAPISPRECARRCAEDTRRFVPDWRAIRPELGATWGKLLKQQPELSPELTNQRRTVLNAIITSLPRHLQATADELHNLIQLMLTAHEAAAYHVGFEAGKLEAEYYTDDRGRIRKARTPPSRQLETTTAKNTSGVPDIRLRLHLGD